MISSIHTSERLDVHSSVNYSQKTNLQELDVLLDRPSDYDHKSYSDVVVQDSVVEAL